MPQNPNFIHTKEYARFYEFCNACHKEGYIGLCYGAAGVGKSVSAQQYASWHIISEDFKRDIPYILAGQPSINMETLNTIVYTPEVINSARTLKEDVTHLMASFNRLKIKSLYKDTSPPFKVISTNFVEMLIIDEADRLQPKALEQ